MSSKKQTTSFDFTGNGTRDLSDYIVSEKDKESEDYLIDMTDAIINRNVDEKSQHREMMFKMRDFYDGIRDPKEYQYLEDNYGIGNSGSINFTPLMRNRIDALVGLLSATEFDYKVSISDKQSLFQIEQQKATKMLEEVFNLVNRDVKAQAEGNLNPLTPIEKIIEEAELNFSRKWRNLFTQAAIDFIEDCRECPITDLKRVRELLFLDIASLGIGIYRVQAKEVGKKPKPEVLLPENCYYTLRRDMKNINRCSEFVYIRYMSKRDVLQEYGHLMDADEKRDTLELDTVKMGDSQMGYMTIPERNNEANNNKVTDKRKKSAVDRYTNYGMDQDVLKVYETEWKANNSYDISPEDVKNRMLLSGPDKVQKKRWRQDLYRSIRIGDRIYLDMGKDESAVRYDQDPDKVFLTFNGEQFSDRGGEPYSILWKGKDVQDKHDILLFHRDNLIASSGVRGIHLEYSSIPEFYGKTEMERVMKALAMIKQGVNLSDNSQEGSEMGGGGSASHGDYDLTINGESLTALNETINQLDNEATKITGVTQQMLGAIEQREAVGNVKTGINQSSLVLKGMFDTHDRVMKHLLTDLINAAKQTIPEEGYQGSYQEGRKIFTIMPKNFSFTNYRLNVINSSQEKAKVDEAKTLIHEAMATQSIPYAFGLRIIMMDNPAEILELAAEIEEKTNSLSKKLAEATTANEQLQKQVEQLTKQVQAVDAEKTQIEKDKVVIQTKLADAKIRIDSQEMGRKVALDDETLDLKSRELDLEEKQMYYSDNLQKQKIRQNIV